MTSWMWVFVSMTVALASGQDPQVRDVKEMHRLHQDSKAYVALLEDPKRDEYQKPHQVLSALDLKVGEVVADIGSGSGYFTFRFARHLGDKGRVYAVDISSEMIRYVNRRIRDTGAGNVVSVLAEPDDPLLPDGSVDRVFICDTWHHLEHRGKYLSLVRKALRPGGQVVVLDFHKRDLPVGPPDSMKVSRDEVLREFEGSGFQLLAEHTFLPYQYFLVFGPSAQKSR